MGMRVPSPGASARHTPEDIVAEASEVSRGHASSSSTHKPNMGVDGLTMASNIRYSIVYDVLGFY